MDVSGGIRERVRCLSGLEKRAFALLWDDRQRDSLLRCHPFKGWSLSFQRNRYGKWLRKVFAAGV